MNYKLQKVPPDESKPFFAPIAFFLERLKHKKKKENWLGKEKKKK